jgi:hypothetical protein
MSSVDSIGDGLEISTFNVDLEFGYVGLIGLMIGGSSAKRIEIGSVPPLRGFEIHFPHNRTAAGDSSCPTSSEARNDSVEPILPSFGLSTIPL